MQLISVLTTLATLKEAVVTALPSTIEEDALATRDDVKQFGTTLCVDVNYGGYCQTFSKATMGLAQGACIRLDDSIRGRASSVQVFKNTRCSYYMHNHCYMQFPGDSIVDYGGCGIYTRNTSIPDLKTEVPFMIVFSDDASKCDGVKSMDKQIRSFICYEKH